RGGPQVPGARTSDHREFSPDRMMYVFAKGHNLYLVELKPEDLKKEESKPEAEKKTGSEKADDKKEDAKRDENKAEEKKDAEKKAEEKKVEEKKTEEKTKEVVTEVGAPQEQAQRRAPGQNPAQGDLPPIPKIDPKLDDTAIQLTTDGAEDYSFA